MQTGFDREFAHLPPLQREVFDHERARLRFEADVFWATEAIGSPERETLTAAVLVMRR